MSKVLKAGLLAVAVTVFGVATAQAASFTNPNITPTAQAASYPGYYNYNGTTDAWLSTNASGAATGYASMNASGLWDNGAITNGSSGVAFLQNNGAELSQTVSNFTAGHQYKITVVANGRSVNGVNMPALSIFVNGVEFGSTSLSPATISEVDPNGAYVTPFRTYTSAVFTASSAAELVAFVNDGAAGQADVTIDIASVAISDVTPTTVPEPASLLLLVLGLGGVAAARRRVLRSV